MLEILGLVYAARFIFEPVWVIFPVQISPSLYLGTLISGHLACVGKGLRVHRFLAKDLMKTGLIC